MYQIIEITGYGPRVWGNCPTHDAGIAFIGKRFGWVIAAEADANDDECCDVMTQSMRQFTIEPVRENNETALWYDTSAELGG